MVLSVLALLCPFDTTPVALGSFLVLDVPGSSCMFSAKPWNWPFHQKALVHFNGK